MRTIKITFLLICWLGLSLSLQAQYHFRTIDSRSGLPDNYVTSILKDKYGFVWMGTLNGLSRYDGFSHRVYDIKKSNSGLLDSNVRRLAEDASGQLWVTTYSGTAYLYDRNQDKVVPDAVSHLKRLGITAGDKCRVFVDADKNLWCVSGRRLTYYRFAEQRKYTMTLSKSPCQVVCRNGRAYSLSQQGELFRLDPFSGTSLYISQIPASQYKLMSMYVDLHGQLWVYGEYVLGVFRLKLDEDMNGKEVLEKVSDDNVLAMAEDREGNQWWGTNSDGVIVRRIDGCILHLLHEDQQNASLPSNHISSLLIEDGLLWVGTSKVGVAMARLGGFRFSVVSTPFREDIGFMAQDAQGKLWIGYDGKGMLRMANDGQVSPIYHMGNSVLASNLVTGGRLAQDGNLYIGTYGGGIYRLDGNGKLERLLASQPLLNYARHVVQDKKGNLWIGSHGNGLWKQLPSGRLDNYNFHNSAMRTNAITDMAYDSKKGNLYVATGTGVYVVDSKGILKDVVSQDDASGTLQHTTVNSVCVDTRGFLWVVTVHGVNVYDAQHHLLREFGKEEGLDHVIAIVSDKQGNLWMTTHEALAHIVVTPNEKEKWSFRIRRYVSEDGLGDVRFAKKALFCMNNGDVLAGGDGKIVRVAHTSQLEDMQQHKVVFTNLYVGNREVVPGGEGRNILRGNIGDVNQLALRYDDDFALTVSCLDYASAAPAHFAYRLGKEGEWIAMEGNRLAFSHLSAGEYLLQVKSLDGTDDADMMAQMTLVVQPPFWLSAYAWCFYVFLLLLAAWGVLMFLKRRQGEKLAMRQMVRERKYQQEMDEAKMRFFTNIGHDIRTPLSLIISPIEQLMADERFAGAKKQLEMVHRNAKSLLNDVNQLIDFRRLDNSMEKLEPTSGDLSQFLLQVSASYQYMSSQKGITMEVEGCENVVDRVFDHAKLKRIVVNLLSNAIKFTPKDGRVSLALQCESEHVVIKVADTGIGIKDKQRVFERFYQEHVGKEEVYTGSGIGLHIVKQYVELMHGQISVVDNVPSGTIFELSLPLPLPAPTSASVEVKPEMKSRKRILVVEDNDDFRSFISDCLSQNYQVASASNGREALEWMQTHDADMVVTDVMMPEMDGMQLCHAIKTQVNLSHIPVIMLTAKTADEHVLSGYREGADDYITKPFNVEILKMRIAKIFEWVKGAQAKFRQPDLKTSEVVVSRMDGELIDKATKIVEEHLDDADFSVEAFGDAMCMSRSALYKKLMAISGRSPIEFMRIIRLRHGLSLVQQRGLTVSEVAYRVGMSPKQFAKFFKEEYGVLPSKYGEE